MEAQTYDGDEVGDGSRCCDQYRGKSDDIAEERKLQGEAIEQSYGTQCGDACHSGIPDVCRQHIYWYCLCGKIVIRCIYTNISPHRPVGVIQNAK